TRDEQPAISSNLHVPWRLETSSRQPETVWSANATPTVSRMSRGSGTRSGPSVLPHPRQALGNFAPLRPWLRLSEAPNRTLVSAVRAAFRRQFELAAC